MITDYPHRTGELALPPGQTRDPDCPHKCCMPETDWGAVDDALRNPPEVATRLATSSSGRCVHGFPLGSLCGTCDEVLVGDDHLLDPEDLDDEEDPS